MSSERVLPFLISSPKSAVSVGSSVRASAWPEIDSIIGIRNFAMREAEQCQWFHLRRDLAEEMLNGENPPELFHDLKSLVTPFKKFGVLVGDSGADGKRSFLFFEVVPELWIVKYVDCEVGTPEAKDAWVSGFFHYPSITAAPDSKEDMCIVIDDVMTITKLHTGESMQVDSGVVGPPVARIARIFLKLCRLLESTYAKTTLYDAAEGLTRAEARRIKNSKDTYITQFHYVDIRPGQTAARAIRKACQSLPKRAHDVRGHLRRLPSGKTTQVRSHRRGTGDYKPSQYRIIKECQNGATLPASFSREEAA